MRSFEDNEKICTAAGDNVMNARLNQRGRPVISRDHGAESTAVDLVCFKCGLKVHLAKTCKLKLWCSYCKSTTPSAVRSSAEDKMTQAKPMARQRTRTMSTSSE